VAAALASGPVIASEKDDVLVPIRQFVEGFNKGDVKAALATCAEQTSIIDEFPPHEWHGAGACQTWANDFVADAKKNGVTDGKVTLGKPRHVDVSGDRAYVIVPTTYAYKLNGKPKQETGSLLTIALQKGAKGWQMTGWTWTKG
jgi:ketosteroid isomerase-like protein